MMCLLFACTIQVSGSRTSSTTSVRSGMVTSLVQCKTSMDEMNTDGEVVVVPPGIFGVPLETSIKYANVAISLQNEHGESFIYGYVPIVVAKCGVFLKEKGELAFPHCSLFYVLTFAAATDVEGIFRLSGSAKRIKDLQSVFNSPPKYGKGLDWTGYTVHDAANILRRYLNQLPEPIVPLEFYQRFREPLRTYQAQAVGDVESKETNDAANYERDDAIVARYQQLITELPSLNRQLLLYILDLLAVFSSKSDLNRMNATNLAAIFQPGIISHPDHDMAPQEYKLSQEVLIYLIENQDNFLIGMSGTAVDEKTRQDVESGSPSLVSSKSNIGRSASNASAGADSLRKYGVRRNVSVSSRHSKNSGGVPSPGTPTSGIPLASASSGNGIARSNTLPSKKSPGINSTRFQRTNDPSTPNTIMAGSPITGPPTIGERTSSQMQPASGSPIIKSQAGPNANMPPPISEAPDPVEKPEGGEILSNANAALANQQPAKERKISSIFSKSPIMTPTHSLDGSKEQRQPNRLRKKQRIPGAASESAQSSQNSLQAEPTPAFHTPLASPDVNTHARLDPLATANPILSNTSATPVAEAPPVVRHAPPGQAEGPFSNNALKPPGSPEPSVHSRSSFSDLDALEDPEKRAEKADIAQKRRHGWRFSSSAKKDTESPLAPPPPIGQNSGARLSTSSLGSSNRPTKSLTAESQATQQMVNDIPSMGYPSVVPFSSQESSDMLKENTSEPEKRGIFGKFRAKMAQSKEERKEREMEKDRAKSPLRNDAEKASSRNSLSAFAQEHIPHRGKSMDMNREETLPKVSEGPSPLPAQQLQPGPPTSQPQENSGG